MPAPKIQTVTVLFTDLVRSTELSAALGPARAERVRREHFGDLQTAIDRKGGHIVKSVGDGVLATFPSTGAAVSCAGAIQRSVVRRNRTSSTTLAVRVGVAVGDAHEDGGDWYGPPVVEAARLCAVADGGHVLVSEAVRLFTATRDGPPLTPMGPIALKGFAEPVDVWSVGWETQPGDDDLPPLPLPLGAALDGFVGRQGERRQLDRAWERVSQGEQRVVVVTGDPGIGKTRLAAEVGRQRHAEGATVLYGRSAEHVGLPYEPWRQALSQLVDGLPDAVLRRHVDRHGPALVRLVPALADRLDLPSAAPTSDPETDRHLLFAAVSALLEETASDRPLLLVLDDLHWSGGPTVSLLRHVLLHRATAILSVVLHRDRELSPEHPVRALVSDLLRDGCAERIVLRGLDAAEIQALLERAGRPVLDERGAALCRQLRYETGGNPFYLGELIRHLQETQALGAELATLQLPASVKEAVGGRVGDLGSDAVRVLRAAAVVGHTFDLDVLATVVGMEHDRVLDVVEQAIGAALVTERQGEAGYAFVHALVRHALEDELSAARRERLHARTAEVLEARMDADAAVPAAQVARHWAEAGPAARTKALDAAARAGWQALAELAPEQAVDTFRAGLELVPARPSGAAAVAHRELLLGLGQAQVRAGHPEGRQTLTQAGHLAEAAGDSDRLVRAAIANSRGFFSSTGRVDQERVDALEAALARVPADDPCKARLLALLAAELVWSPSHVRRKALSDEAVELARARGDLPALAHVLANRVTAVWWPETLGERLKVTDELLELSERIDDPVQRFWALTWRAVTVTQACGLAEADRRLAELLELTARLGQPKLRFVLCTQESWRAQLRGSLEAAEHHARRAATIGTQAAEPDAESLYVAQVAPIRWHQGRLAELVDELAFVAAAVPGVGAFRAFAALAAFEAGRTKTARDQLAADARTGFANVLNDPVTLGSLVLWAELAARLGDREAAGVLHERLEPSAGHVVLDSLGVLGAVNRARGLAAATAGRARDADAHFARALEAHEQMGAASLAARTRVEWGEARSAADLLAQGAAAARELDLPGIERRAERALADVRAQPVRVRVR